jgi:hypothetical protein
MVSADKGELAVKEGVLLKKRNESRPENKRVAGQVNENK